ncbi:hypothetical protein [Pyxidicoccus xibeiensis]|uniref:hypothetical protein n=1 Tax=Pyxidicoccus xibeiensis TaxID=2906759 RepID=UPI0020A7B4F6|nr:hypothetical protein [Pyxidicoccus xibeiensis]MCP3136974.1 hypothetical protein [Pyxidicoccus xibeiensis]
MFLPCSVSRASVTVSVLLLAYLLAPAAHAASDAPLRQAPGAAPAAHAAPAAAGDDRSEDWAPTDSGAHDTADGPAASGSGGMRPPGMSGPRRPEDEERPLSAGLWAAHGGMTLLPLAGVWGATRVGGDTRLAATASETASGMLLGSLTIGLLFFRPVAPSPERWLELEVVAFGGGLVLTPPLAALGTWGVGELAFGGSRNRGDAYLGALGGAATGALLGVVAHAVLTKLSGPNARLRAGRELIALGFIGAGATLGYQWAGGGRRADEHAR